MPKDVQFAKIERQPLVYPVLQPPSVEPSLLEQAKILLQQAKRPVLYVGGGVGMADAVAELRHFVEITQIPSFSTIKGLGALPADNPYYMGMIGMHGTKAANYAAQESDLLLVLGARFDDRVTGKLIVLLRQQKLSTLMPILRKLINYAVLMLQFAAI